MATNKRNSNRIGLVIEIKLTRQDNAVLNFKSRNISDTGVFLELENDQHDFALDEEVILQVSSMIGGEPAPPVPASIIRICDDGMGLRFKEAED